MKQYVWVFCFCWFSFGLIGQENNLANQYFNDGEYEKAATIYKNLYNTNPAVDFYFKRLMDCFGALGKYNEAETLVKKEISKRPKESQLYITYAQLLEKQGDLEKSNKQYKEALKTLDRDPIQYFKLGSAFLEDGKYDLAIEVYEKGDKITGGNAGFAYNLADVYRRKGDIQKMLEYYIIGLDNKTIQVASLKNVLISYLPQDKYADLQGMIYDKLDKNPDNLDYLDLLQWSFLQKKDFANALRQAKAIDKITSGNGSEVYELALIIENESDYKTAIDGFNYIKNLGEGTAYYLEAERHILICRRNQIIQKNDYNQLDLTALEQEYEEFRIKHAKSRALAPLMIEYAELEARYLNNISKAIQILDELVKNPIIDQRIKSQAKLDLADYYLISGERWESTLLYSQVDKDYMEDQLGEMARFRNAKLSYFAGDFHWAQEQFDILKHATSKLISNDAIDLSVFILDNLNQDTTGEALTMYSQAELKVFQNQYEEALAILDTILIDYKENSLVDDVWYLQGQIFNKQKKTELAIEKFNGVVDKYKEDIRADNSLYELAKIYDYQKEDKTKAMELYERLFTEYSGSVLAVESRKRFRKLRGDNI